ncbi:ParB family protein [Solimonas sp. SE-A11]|uniref:ParB family protein n=1 Tax=Solimonas sp. SE-A11 TaxID=3054954 RepID=UPI00259CC7C4|nr:ParB family protein [Solimonas sp. SE-A11]MDM4770853.1 ParB N-terminal domain-containing protein [Solimonas sp. SE-A11]
MSSKRKPSDSELSSMLQMPHFGSSRDLQPSDPITVTPMVVEISRIDGYENNPRRTKNAAYEDIKESIRSQGLKQPLIITRRPAAPNYMLKHGGNTRLTILKELFTETGEDRFTKVNCLFEPWSGEADVLVGHLVENETRGDLTFIDKARAVRQAADLLEGEAGEKLSLRQLSSKLMERGYRVSFSLLGQLFYTMNVLEQVIPLALGNGMGRPGIQRIRQLDAAATKVWIRHGLGDEDSWSPVLQEALATCDSSDWDHDRARRAIEAAIAARAGISVRQVTVELGAELIGNSAEGSSESGAQQSRAAGAAPDAGTAQQQGDGGKPGAAPAAQRLEAAQGAKPPAPLQKTPTASSAAAAGGHRLPAQPPQTANPSQSPADTGPRLDDDLAPQDPRATTLQLRLALRAAAEEFAAHVGMQDCFKPWQRANGYIVTELPRPELVSAVAENEFEQLLCGWSWWLLATCADLLPACARHEEIPEFTQLIRPRLLECMIQEDMAAAIGQHLPIADAAGFGYGFVSYSSETTWSKGLQVLLAYRELTSFAKRAEIDLLTLEDPS